MLPDARLPAVSRSGGGKERGPASPYAEEPANRAALHRGGNQA